MTTSLSFQNSLVTRDAFFSGRSVRVENRLSPESGANLGSNINQSSPISNPPLANSRITVSESGTISSPFVQISERASEFADLQQPLPDPSLPDYNLQAEIRQVDQRQQEIQNRQVELSEQEDAIEQEINQLQRKELELNRKRFQLQQQSNLGSIVNLQA